MIKGCIFDLDGTLLNTITTITHYVNATLQKHNVEMITEEDCKRFIGNGAYELIRRALEFRSIDNKDAIERVLLDYNNAYNGEPLYLTEPYEGIRELLSCLKEKGIKLAVLSNKPDETTKSVVSSIFPNVFDVVMGARDDVPLKPDITAPKLILSMLSLDNDEVMMIGDSAPDMQTGVGFSAGLTVGVAWGFRSREELWNNGADVVVENPLQILARLTEVE